jgi:tetratricopeptide (TPR) repeat protein
LRRFPGEAELLRLQGLAFYALGRKQEALASFLAAMDAAPGDEMAYASVETLLGDAGDQLPQVYERLNRFSALRPDSPLAPFLLALASSSPQDQERLLRKAIALDAGFWPAYFELHRRLREQGKRQEAIDALEATLRLNPNHEGAHFALAELYLEAGDREKARAHRMEHHRLRAAAAADEQKRTAEAPKFAVKLQ